MTVSQLLLFSTPKAVSNGHVTQCRAFFEFAPAVAGRDLTRFLDKEAGYHFSSVRLMLGDYLSVRKDDGLHTFQVASVEPL
jgi:hypothetical protein